MKAALESRDLAEVLTDDNVGKGLLEKALSIFISALSDDTLRALQDITRVKAAWYKLQSRYVDISIVNNLSTLTTVLNTNFKRVDDIANYIANLKSRISRLATISSELGESMKVAIFLSSHSERSEFTAIAASVTTMEEQVATNNYIFMLFMKGQRRICESQAVGPSHFAPEQNTLKYSSSNAGLRPKRTNTVSESDIKY